MGTKYNYYCDFCGNETQHYDKLVKLSVSLYDPKADNEEQIDENIDICRKCYKKDRKNIHQQILLLTSHILRPE